MYNQKVNYNKKLTEKILAIYLLVMIYVTSLYGWNYVSPNYIESM